MLKLYADMERLDARYTSLVIAGQKLDAYPESENITEKLHQKLNPFDIRHAMLTEVIYLVQLCERKNEPHLMKAIFNDAGWTEDIFEWLEIDPNTGIGIEPKTDEEITVHNLRATHGRNVFRLLGPWQKTRKVVDTYVFQSPGFIGYDGTGVNADIAPIPPDMLSENIIVYIAQICPTDVLKKLPSKVFTDSVAQRIAAEAPAEALSILPEETLTDAVLFLFYRHHDKSRDLRRWPQIDTSRKASILDIALAQEHIDHKLLNNICNSISNLDELPASTECKLVHNSPHLLRHFMDASTVFDTDNEGNFSPFAIQMAHEALTCTHDVPNPYNRYRTMHKGSDVARKLLPAALIEICEKNIHQTKLERSYGITKWYNADLVAAATSRGIEMSDEQAQTWWQKNEAAFKSRMAELGNEVLADMLSYQKEELA